MCAPKPPNALSTASAQTGSNLQTAIGQSYLNNVNQQTPWGTTSTNVSGYNTIKGPDGTEYQIPQFTQNTQLSDRQRDLLWTQEEIQQQQLHQAYARGGVLGNALNKDINAPQYTQFGSGPKLQTGIANAGNITGQIANSGQVLNSFDSGGNVNRQIANAGDISGDIASGGNIQNSFNGGGPINGQIANAGNITDNIAGSGNVTKQIANAGNVQKQLGSQDTWGRVQDVENALFSRYNPQLEQDRQRLETQLANQGVRVGSTAWNTAMDAQNRNVNDARLGITINAGQEQNRLQQLDLNSGNFANAAQAQQYSQNANNAQFANAAQAQQYGQNANNAQFANAAQAQRYGQNANNTAVANAAQAQQFGQNAALAQFNNAAQEQRYGQNANNAAFRNAAQAQQFGQNAAQAQFGNNALAQQFGQNAAQAQFANAGQAQLYGQNANNAQFSNAAQAQQYGQNANNAAFANTANQAMYQNQFNATQANNGLQDSQFANQLAQRNQLINEQSALMSGQQVGMPQFGSTPQTQVGGTDVASLINGQYQSQLAAHNNAWAGIGQLGAAALPFMLSDKRAKTDIQKIGKLGKGINAYTYRYRGDDTPQVGVMAQEVEKVIPSAVRKRPDGFREVNYGRVFGALAKGAA